MNFELPVVTSERDARRPVVIHCLRVALFAAIVWLIHDQHRLYQAEQAHRDAANVEVDTVLPFYPGAVSIAPWVAGGRGRNVVDADGTVLGFVVQTSPQSDNVIGYSGPTNTLVAFDTDGRITGMTVLSSGDTTEHVNDVLRDTAFLQELVGLTWDEAAYNTDIDAVSGATLTSLAITEGIRFRFGGTQKSERFRKPVTINELRSAIPTAHSIANRKGTSGVVDVFDRSGKKVGAFIRTSPWTDNLNGYQGPTDTLIIFDADDRVTSLSLRETFDNEQYVGTARDDYYFPTIFEGKTIEELAAFDVEAAGVEGVSGATMTSVAVAKTLPIAVRRASAQPYVWRLSVRDVGTIAVVVIAFAMCFTRLRSRRWARICFQVALIIYLGFINGDLVSQTLLVGWARSGVRWRVAFGLAMLTAATLMVPLFSKHQIYCSHICPFGAAQQLIRHRSGLRIHLPRWFTRWLAALPTLLLVVVLATAMAHLPLNLAALEPFDAFLFQIAGWSTLTIAIIGLTASACVPMAYCRFGCPTGAMLEFLRFHARSDRVGLRDFVAIAMLLFAVGMRWL